MQERGLNGQPQKIAVFDLDRTITRIGTFSPFLLSTCRSKPLSCLKFTGLLGRMLSYRLGHITRRQLKEIMLAKMLNGSPRSDVGRWAERFAGKLSRKGLHKDAVSHIKKHQAAGDFTVLATASMDFYAEPIGRTLGFDRVVSTRSCWDANDRLIPQLDGENCYGPHKLNFLRAALADKLNQNPRPHITAYSDHISDSHMLDWADEPVVVNPNPSLRDYAAQMGYRVVHWH